MRIAKSARCWICSRSFFEWRTISVMCRMSSEIIGSLVNRNAGDTRRLIRGSTLLMFMLDEVEGALLRLTNGEGRPAGFLFGECCFDDVDAFLFQIERQIDRGLHTLV